MAEVFKGYRIRMEGFEDFVQAVLALHKYAHLENGRVLVKRGRGLYSFVVSLLSQEEADRFTFNFSQDTAFPSFKEFSPSPGYEAQCSPVGQLLPESVTAKLAEMLATDTDLIDNHIASIVERDETVPSADYLIQVPDEEKQAWIRERSKRRKQ
jgi:hypothetical protein